VVGCGFVGTAIASDRAGFAADGETHNERPDKHPNVDLAVTDDDLARSARSSIICEGNSEVRMERIASEESSSISPSPHRYCHR
jgi:hypothetical protein